MKNSLTVKTFLLLSFMFGSLSLFSQTFVSPIGFVQNETNKQRVIRFIEHQVRTDYAAIGITDPVTLRMMEDENMSAFKELIQVTNTALLRQVIDTYCEIGMCNYSTIWMMYEEQAKASNKSLRW